MIYWMENMDYVVEIICGKNTIENVAKIRGVTPATVRKWVDDYIAYRRAKNQPLCQFPDISGIHF